ncbi:MAG: DUF2662 domain-containing protein [Acidobacteria bacterium]|nr:MAG: DUF2662 domain-containing protein [Acidobacteriota bacterium]REK01246.1 MAG: DUF2662 domain-containing protein [Acidobacteriota bacterium]REK14202.1 MAG: DUF2662 domain-containing protein [Acidobacteriota bacterium]REK44917.1 MAG: DUF2662 domain-containing protein [Acidobacteriota bacterium]
MSVLDKVRRWIDGESAELVLEKAARDAQVKPRSEAEEFIVKIARAVEDVMQKEMVPLPQGTTIIPTEYLIFLSEDDDKDWRGAKRRGLEQGLYHVLAERAKELAGKKKLETQSFAVELRVDGTLETGDIRVQHSWEEDSSSKTGVLPRKKPGEKGLDATIQRPASKTPRQPGHTPRNLDPPDFIGQGQQPVATPRNNAFAQVTPISSGEEEELTAVSTRKTSLYELEVWKGGVRQTVIPIYQSEVVIGRGSASKPVDIALKGDPEVSRRHVVLILDKLGTFTVINEGRNPAMLNSRELPIGQRITLEPGQPLSICSYMVRVQPR